MRVTGGTLRGRQLPSPCSDLTRPTTDMWRSTIFDALEHIQSLQGARVLDVFAGTGALGFEALSRGALSLTSVESSRQQAQQIQYTAHQLEVATRCSIIHDDVRRWLHALPPSPAWDLVLADPPYDLRIGSRLLTLIGQQHIVTNNALVVLEHSPDEYVETPQGWLRVWSKCKGDTAVDMFRYQQPAP